MAENIVEMRHITKRFPGVIANNDISLEIKKGEIFALLGENGAGKSTLMSMLFGMYEPDEGEIIVRGKPVRISSPSHAVELDIGMVHQHFKLVHNYTVTENIVLGIEPTRRFAGFIPYVDIKGTNDKIAALSRRYGLEVDPTSVIEDLKVSAQQRVEILKMLYREAEILIFDEPTAMLTPQEIEFLLQIIINLRDGGKTIILITHKLQEIKQVADRCAVLNHGKLISVLDVPSTSTHEMARQMVGREISFELEKKEPEFGEAVLKVANLTVENSDKFEVVKDVSFNIRRGEVFAIAGVAGNGQVEIADAITGLAKIKSGTVHLKGTDITALPVRQRNLEGIAYIPEDRQEVGLIMEFSLRENLAMKKYFMAPFSKGSILQQDVMEDYAARLITDYDIRSGSGGATIVRSMSGGNQQKAIIAREVEQDCDFLIFVQPTRGLDIGAITSIREKIIALRDAGKAILLISLELDEIMSCADTIGVVYNGEMRHIAPAKEITVDELGEHMMGVKRSE